jgi:inosine/xanthosine triphosphate pyrophosphatase family protein
MKLLLATGNSGKIAEIRQILGQKPVKLITMAASGSFRTPRKMGNL